MYRHFCEHIPVAYRLIQTCQDVCKAIGIFHSGTCVGCFKL